MDKRRGLFVLRKDHGIERVIHARRSDSQHVGPRVKVITQSGHEPMKRPDTSGTVEGWVPPPMLLTEIQAVVGRHRLTALSSLDTVLGSLEP